MSEQARKSQREMRANLLASFGTGVTIISFTNPMDTLKCRWQVAACGKDVTFASFSRNIISVEGLWSGLWRPGLPPNMLAMGCAIGCRNGFYPTIRDSFGYLTQGSAGPTGMFFAGLASGCAGYVIASPLLQVKTQMQAEAGIVGKDGLYETGNRVGSAPTYRSSFHAFRAIASSGEGVLGGVRALWRGAGVIVGRGAVLSATQLMTYDNTKKQMKASKLMQDGPMLHVLASLAAAAVCTTCSMPFDVVLTVYQSAHSFGGDRLEHYGRRGPLGCATVMFKESGPTIFMRGWTPAFMRLAPTCVASFWLYEQLRKLVGIGFLD
eukprot:TRINITY_DN88521_c0_g1_i1.p1 TRINITY_DN88521_c0_g1~~TRINITY_DN88521_c0_g1_i1.p1  ORF type:complete len:323 (+),score=23.13 TRINITY_DN88521_c0_g1_i1:51-1019(+)